MPNMNLLRMKIRERGMTITDLCDVTGLERPTMYNKLNDRGGEWKISEVKKVTEALRLSRDEQAEIFLK